MQQMPQRGMHKRALAAREALPGYPWLDKFKSRAELMAYLSGDAITCLLCGKPYKALAPHVKRTHGMPTGDYKAHFGIPQKYGVTCADFRAKQSANSRLRIPELRSIKPWLKARGAKPKYGPRNGQVYFVREEMAARVRPYVGRRTYKDDEFEWHIKTAATVYACRDVAPPAGHAAWSTFKNRRLKDQALNARYRAARASRCSASPQTSL